MEENKTPGSGKLNPIELLEQIKTASARLENQISQLNTESDSMQRLTVEACKLFDIKVRELKNSVSGLELSISPEDVKKLDSYKDYFKHYKPILYISILSIVSCWVLYISAGYFANKWYRESVRTKEEVRTEVLQEIKNTGNIIVEKQKWEDYKEQASVVNAWKKSNDKEAQSLINYIKGYEEFKKKGK